MRTPLWSSSELRAEGEADFAFGCMPQKAKCVVPFIESRGEANFAYPQNKKLYKCKDKFLRVKYSEKSCTSSMSS